MTWYFLITTTATTTTATTTTTTTATAITPSTPVVLKLCGFYPNCFWQFTHLWLRSAPSRRVTSRWRCCKRRSRSLPGTGKPGTSVKKRVKAIKVRNGGFVHICSMFILFVGNHHRFSTDFLFFRHYSIRPYFFGMVINLTTIFQPQNHQPASLLPSLRWEHDLELIQAKPTKWLLVLVYDIITYSSKMYEHVLTWDTYSRLFCIEM